MGLADLDRPQGFGVAFRVSGVGVRLLESGFRVSDCGCSISCFVSRVPKLFAGFADLVEFRVWGLWSGLRDEGFEFQVHGVVLEGLPRQIA